MKKVIEKQASKQSKKGRTKLKFKLAKDYLRRETIALRFASGEKCRQAMQAFFDEPRCVGMPLSVLDSKTLIIPRKGSRLVVFSGEMVPVRMELRHPYYLCDTLETGITIHREKNRRKAS